MRHIANRQVPRNGFSCFGELTPLPSPLPLPSPPPSPRPSQIVSFGRDTHTPKIRKIKKCSVNFELKQDK